MFRSGVSHNNGLATSVAPYIDSYLVCTKKRVSNPRWSGKVFRKTRYSTRFCGGEHVDRGFSYDQQSNSKLELALCGLMQADVSICGWCVFRSPRDHFPSKGQISKKKHQMSDSEEHPDLAVSLVLIP